MQKLYSYKYDIPLNFVSKAGLKVSWFRALEYIDVSDSMMKWT